MVGGGYSYDPHFVDFSEGDGVKRLGFAQSSSRGQADFLPLPRLFAGARSRCHRAEHTPVGLGNDIGLTHRRQNPEGFLVLSSEALFCPAGMVEGGIAHGTDVHFKTIMFQHSRCSVLERMLATKVGQHTFQALGATSRSHANGLWQQPQIVLVLGAPDPLGHPHQSKYAPPT